MLINLNIFFCPLRGVNQVIPARFHINFLCWSIYRKGCRSIRPRPVKVNFPNLFKTGSMKSLFLPQRLTFYAVKFFPPSYSREDPTDQTSKLRHQRARLTQIPFLRQSHGQFSLQDVKFNQSPRNPTLF